ncbi:MAG TPA: AI-2E family transporter [Sphingobium sp.]
MNDENLAGYRDISVGNTDHAPAAIEAAQVPPISSPELKSLLGITVGALSVAALYFAKDVLIPIMLAVMLSFVLSPAVNVLQRLRLWRAPAVILTVLATLGIAGLIGTLIGSQATALSANAPQYARTIEAKVEGVQGYAIRSIATVTKALGTPKSAAERRGSSASTILSPSGPASPAQGALPPATNGRRPVLVEMAPQEASPVTIARTILAPIIGPLETTFIVLVVAIFVLLQKEDLRDRFIRVFGSNDLHRTTLAMDDAGKRLSRYFLSQLAVNTGFGAVIGIGLWMIGIPSPAMWGILAGLLRFVPYIGSFIAAVAPMALGAAIDPGWTITIYVALLFVIVEPLTGYVVEPMLYGHSTGLSPVSVIISAVFWTWLWGPIGLIMSTPLTLCLVVMGRHVKSLEFFDVLLGDRPALSPVESFYQRILANNPDEALAQAELFLTDRPLVDYYDDVVLHALTLAAEDEARGMIDRARSIQMTRSMLEVIHDLHDHAEGEEAVAIAATGGRSIVCIAGRGVFDATVSAMLLQLLERRGHPTRIIPNSALSRDAIGTLDLNDADVIALTYLHLSGTPPHLPHLIRRLRQRAPGARIVVGLWPAEGPPTDAAILQQKTGADDHCHSLHGMMAAIIGEDATDPYRLETASRI